MNIREESIKNLFQGNQESREIEFKRGFEWEYPTAKSLELIKTVLCMYNTPQGGNLILGIKEGRNNSKPDYIGMTKEEIDSFERNEEIIKAIINSYCNTTIIPMFEIIKDPTFDMPKSFLIIKIPHYQEYPNITKRDGDYIKSNGEKDYKFRKNDLLTRSKSPKYSNTKASQEELNEMIELGAKGVRSKCKDILNLTSINNKSTEKKVLKEFSQKYQKERRNIYGDF